MKYELDLVNKEPIIKSGGPEWWSPHGIKMCADEKFLPGYLLIKSDVAKLKIYADSQCMFKKILLPWYLEWVIIHSSQERVDGKVMMSTDALKSAFVFADTTSRGSRWLIERYGGEVAEQGKFIRWKNFLNIPGPGTGQDGDPNISIFLDDVIKNSVFNLIYPTLTSEERRHWTVHEACKEYFKDEGIIRPTNITDDYPS